MKISRNNYEPWFMDYLDGNLSDAEIRMFEKFLAENPDLRKELEGMENTRIYPEDIRFERKDLLRKADLSLPVSKNNFEDFCVADAEGDLTTEQGKALENYIRDHKEEEKTRALYGRMKLVPDTEIVFPRKDNLKKTILVFRREVLYPVLSVAAAITFLMIIYLSREDASNGPGVVTADLPAEVIKAQPEVAETGTIPRNEIIPEEKPAVQQASVIALTVRAEKKNITEEKARETTESEKEENRSKKTLPPQKLNPSFEIKLPSIADNRETESAIDGKKIAGALPGKQQKENEYLTLSEYAKKQLKEKLLGDKAGDDTKLSGWQVADAGITGINKLTGSKMKLERTTTEEGKVTAYSFDSRLLSFSTPAKK